MTVFPLANSLVLHFYGSIPAIRCRLLVSRHSWFYKRNGFDMSERDRIMAGRIVPGEQSPPQMRGAQEVGLSSPGHWDQDRFDQLDANADGVIVSDEFKRGGLAPPARVVLADYTSIPLRRLQHQRQPPLQHQHQPPLQHQHQPPQRQRQPPLQHQHQYQHQLQQRQFPKTRRLNEQARPKGRRSPKMQPTGPKLTLKQIFSKFACSNPLSSKSNATFDEISRANKMMDYTEFWRFAMHYKLVCLSVCLPPCMMYVNLIHDADDVSTDSTSDRTKLSEAHFLSCKCRRSCR